MHVMRSAVQKNLAASHRASRGSHFSSKQRAQLQFSMMKTSHSNSLWALTVLFTSALLVAQTQALYFFLENGVAKCFYEELPKDTLVVGKYKAEVFNPNTHKFEPSSTLVISVAVEETFQNDHRVVNTRGSPEGRFTFSAAESGDHRICFTPAHAGTNGGWLANGTPVGGIKLSLDLATGETSQIESTDKGKLSDIVQRVKDLNARLHDIRREQVFQREREAEFRDQSETTNARVVRWTLLQLVVLGLTCAWQLTHLRAFFIKQKLT